MLSFHLHVRRLSGLFVSRVRRGPEVYLSFESGPTVGESSSQFLILIFGPGLSVSRKRKVYPDVGWSFVFLREELGLWYSESLEEVDE